MNRQFGHSIDPNTRRQFFKVSAMATSGLLVAAAAPAWGEEYRESKERRQCAAEDVSPPEDLMREHGVLKRVMLVYDEILRRWDAKQDVPPETLAAAAGIIRSFVEDYHEKLEEDYLFPRFEKANKLTDLVKTLKEQHLAGAKLPTSSCSGPICKR